MKVRIRNNKYYYQCPLTLEFAKRFYEKIAVTQLMYFFPLSSKIKVELIYYVHIIDVLCLCELHYISNWKKTSFVFINTFQCSVPVMLAVCIIFWRFVKILFT